MPPFLPLQANGRTSVFERSLANDSAGQGSAEPGRFQIFASNFQINSLNELTAYTNGGKLTDMGTATPQRTGFEFDTQNIEIGMPIGDFSSVRELIE
jgi:hypothetical protein